MTAEEIAQTILRSNVFNVIVEGRDDYVVYNSLEDEEGLEYISVLPVNGRSTALKVFELLKDKDFKNIVYIVDKDYWVHTGIPDEYKSDRIITTDGYSVENDLLIDLDVTRIMSREERLRFIDHINTILPWYSCQIKKVIDKKKSYLSENIGPLIFAPDHAKIKFHQETEFDHPDEFLIAEVDQNPLKMLRGKTLLSIAMFQLERKGRPNRHSAGSLLEIATSRRGDNLIRIRDQLIDIVKSIQSDSSEAISDAA